MMTDISHRYADRHGGYTRVLRTRRRKGDNAQMAFVEVRRIISCYSEDWRETDRDKQTETDTQRERRVHTPWLIVSVARAIHV